MSLCQKLKDPDKLSTERRVLRNHSDSNRSFLEENKLNNSAVLLSTLFYLYWYPSKPFCLHLIFFSLTPTVKAESPSDSSSEFPSDPPPGFWAEC